MKQQGYAQPYVQRRRQWLEQKAGCRLAHIGAHSIPSDEMRGNIENPVGAAQMPLGVAGPLLIKGTNAHSVFYVPLATTEGALVRSYERGMVALTRAGGVTTRVYVDENRVSPVFLFESVERAHEFAITLPGQLEAIRAEAESTTRHGKLQRIECHPVGREVIVNFCYFTGDAHGMNMIVKATEHACQWIMDHCDALHFYVFSGFSSEKRADRCWPAVRARR
jgi:hydroxymethylglutaryl-CoA reductase (NADPH)